MSGAPASVGELHRRALSGFTAVVEATGARWDLPTPCPEWDARGIVEHVIGFHEVLMLRPLGVRANRPREGPAERWVATSRAIESALDEDLQMTVEVPGSGEAVLSSLVEPLTTDVLVHTWDLARATGGLDTLDGELVGRALQGVERAGDRLSASGMYAPPVPVPRDAEPQDRLIALTGRDPTWIPPER